MFFLLWSLGALDLLSFCYFILHNNNKHSAVIIEYLINIKIIIVAILIWIFCYVSKTIEENRQKHSFLLINGHDSEISKLSQQAVDWS